MKWFIIVNQQQEKEKLIKEKEYINIYTILLLISYNIKYIPYNEDLISILNNKNYKLILRYLVDNKYISLINELELINNIYNTNIYNIYNYNNKCIDNILELININNNRPKTQNFKKPTLEEVKEHCQNKKYNIDPEQFYLFYESNGWMIGKSKMKDWKATVARWNKQPHTTNNNKIRIVQPPEWFKEIYENPTPNKQEESEKEPEKAAKIDLNEFLSVGDKK